MTSVLHAAELLGCAESEKEREAVEGLLLGLKVVGLNGRYATTMARLRGTTSPVGSSSTVNPLTVEAAALAALAIESRLAIVTERLFGVLCNIPGVRVLSAAALQEMDELELREALAVAGATRRWGE